MSPTERKNSYISVEFGSLDSGAVFLGREVERLWNGGHYDGALAQLRDLEARVGQVAIGNSWRTPVPTTETALWGDDIRIGNRDSLLELAFDRSIYQGRLFVVLLHGHGPECYSVCMSSDSGATWVETFTWVGSPVTCLDAGALGDFFVAYYSPGENAQQVRVRRFQMSDGSAREFRTGDMWVAACTLDVGDTLREVSFASSGSSVLVIASLVSDGNVLLSRSDGDAVSWLRMSIGAIPVADRGLGATFNMGPETTWFLVSYVDLTDTLRIYGRYLGAFTQRLASLCGTGAITSIAANYGTVVCAYEDGTTSPPGVRYASSSDGGNTWVTGTLSDSGSAADAPAVTVPISGAEPGAVFRRCSSICELRSCQYTGGGSWNDPISIADNEPYRLRPGIRRIDTSGVYGVVYLSDTSPVVRGAYFVRGEFPTGVIEQQPQRSKRWPRATVARSVLRMSIDDCRMSNGGLLDIGGRKVMDLRPGANDVRALAPGVYFVHSPSPYSSPPEGERVGVRRRPASVTKVVVTR